MHIEEKTKKQIFLIDVNTLGHCHNDWKKMTMNKIEEENIHSTIS